LVSDAIVQAGEEARRVAESRGEREEEIRKTFLELFTTLQIREEFVVNECQRASAQQEKRILSEMDELEFVVAGLQGAVAFGSRVVAGGNHVEVATDRLQVIERLENLLVLSDDIIERRKKERAPVFVNNETKLQLSEAINNFGKLLA